jgi:hypothetical protein
MTAEKSIQRVASRILRWPYELAIIPRTLERVRTQFTFVIGFEVMTLQVIGKTPSAGPTRRGHSVMVEVPQISMRLRQRDELA